MSVLFFDNDIVIQAAYVLVGIATFIVARMLFQEQETRQAQENLAEGAGRSSSNPLVKLTKPLFSQYVLPIVRGRPYWEERRRAYRRKLIAAGLKDELSPDELIAFKILLVAFFPIVGGLLRAFDMLELNMTMILLSGVGGWFYPDFWVKSRADARRKEILKSMPFIVDLLALSTEAGLDFVGAIGKVVEKANPSPLVEEFAQLLKEIKVGASRQEALREMGTRIDMQQMNSFIAILISADQMGASIGKILRQQSDTIRSERMLRAEKAGAAASQKVLIPLVFFIVPAVFLMIGGPFIVNAVYGTGN